MAPTERPPRASERRPKRPTRPKPEATETPTPVEPEPKKRTPADKKLAGNVAGIYQMLGATMLGIGMRTGDEGLAGSGVKTIESAEPIAEAWLDLADTNPAVKRALVRLTEVSAAGVLVTMHITIALPVLVTRGIVPEQFAAFAASPPPASDNGNPTHN